ISVLLIMPAAAARRFSVGTEQMAVLAAVIGVMAVIGGLVGSLQWDTPAGPSIVVVALLLFLIGLMPPAGGAAKSRKETS
ncbi:MAG: metal ABC transporter permease, partial [Rhizobiaceae bacterium]